MPYNNLPRNQWAKMDRCVTKVQARGKEKKRAIAICYSSIVGKEDDMSNSRKKRRQFQKEKLEREAEERGATLGLIGTVSAEVQQEQVIEPVVEDVTEESDLTPEESVMVEEVLEEIDSEDKKSKDYGENPSWKPTFGATSFVTLQEMRDAHEKAQEVVELTDDLHRLIDNVMWSPDVSDKPSAIKKLVDEYGALVKSEIKKETGEENEEDEDSEEVEEDEENEKSFFEEVVAFFKAKIGGAARNDLPDSAFAYIEPGGEKDESGKTVPRSLRHYPIHDAAHVRNALARASAAIGKGGKTAEIARKALPKIRAAAKRHKIGEENKKDFYPFQIFKDEKGDYRYVALVTNNFVDKDNDIITDEAHKEFMEYLDAHPEEAPELWVWHTPGTAHKNRADFWEYENGFVMYSGKLTEEEANCAEKASAYTELGMSHGMNVFGLKRDSRPKLITKYRTFEISYLPLSNAANPWTAWSVIQKEVDTMKDEKKKFLVETLGQEVAEALISDTGKAKQVLDALGVASKETTEESQEQPVATPDVETIVKAVAESLGMAQLSEVISNLTKSVEELKADKENTQKVLAELQKTEDEKVAELIQVTPSQQYAWLGKAQSQSDETVVPETDPIVQQTPKPSWISQVMQ